MTKNRVFIIDSGPPLYFPISAPRRGASHQVNVGAPVLLAQEDVRSTPPLKPRWHWSVRVATESHSKITKMQLFLKLFWNHWRVLKSLRSTLRAHRTFQELVLKLSETFHFLHFFYQKWSDPELQRNIPNIKRSNFEAFPPPICSIFHKELESGD